MAVQGRGPTFPGREPDDTPAAGAVPRAAPCRRPGRPLTACGPLLSLGSHFFQLLVHFLHVIVVGDQLAHDAAIGQGQDLGVLGEGPRSGRSMADQHWKARRLASQRTAGHCVIPAHSRWSPWQPFCQGGGTEAVSQRAWSRTALPAAARSRYAGPSFHRSVQGRALLTSSRQEVRPDPRPTARLEVCRSGEARGARSDPALCSPSTGSVL